MQGACTTWKRMLKAPRYLGGAISACRAGDVNAQMVTVPAGMPGKTVMCSTGG